MPTTIRKVYFDFYQCETISGNNGLPRISTYNIFDRFKQKYDSPIENTVRTINTRPFELRYIERTDYGYRGIIGKYRQAELPHAAVPGGGERELELNENEHLVEKAFFKFYADYDNF